MASSSGNSGGDAGTGAVGSGGATNGTPQEEIDRQHQEAMGIVESGVMQALSASNFQEGEIPLSYKQRPTVDIFGDYDRERHSGNEEEEGTAEEEKKSDFKEGQPEKEKPPPLPPQEQPLEADKFPCWSSRGWVDVLSLQDLVREGYNSKPANEKPSSWASQVRRKYKRDAIQSRTNLWCEANAATYNVALSRPSHDSWGIHKIMLIFCDDFLQTVYELPWWHARTDLRMAIQPILDDVLHIPTRRIVRLLLASLPPGITIPLHSDSGIWVKHTHRIHVPVLVQNPNRVLFRCGINKKSSNLDRIDCTPGHVFEINNQAIHAVSNTDTDYRVHLILDYIDDPDQHQSSATNLSSPTSIPNRIRLDPGEIVLQTRRSVDRLKDRGKRKTPSFMILGAQKAGTTSLYEYMMQHPLLIRPTRRETHCFDWRWKAPSTWKTFEEKQEGCLEYFRAKEMSFHPSCLTGDSTPSYLLDSVRVIPRIQQVFPWLDKFFIMVREPVARAESHYAMVTSPEGTPAQLKARGKEWRTKSIQQIIHEEIRNMSKCGLIPYWNHETGICNQTLFDGFSGTQQENDAWKLYLSKHVPLGTGSHNLISRGMYELCMRPWFEAFQRHNFLMIRLDELHDTSGGGGVNETMRHVWKHLGVPEYEIQDVAPKNSRDYESSLDDETRGYLQRFYEPHNRRLDEIMKDKYSWRY